MFRRLYWVTEQLEEGGASHVRGVFTSIPDLIRKGIAREGSQTLRLTLVKLDSDGEALGTWTAPDFDRIEADLQPFVRTDEFSVDHCKALSQALASASGSNKVAAGR